MPPFIPATATSPTASSTAFLPLNTSTTDDTASIPAPAIAPTDPPLFTADVTVFNVATFPSALSAILFVVFDEIPVDFTFCVTELPIFLPFLLFHILLFYYNDLLLFVL